MILHKVLTVLCNNTLKLSEPDVIYYVKCQVENRHKKILRENNCHKTTVISNVCKNISM